MINCLILEGGGSKFITHIGALECLSKKQKLEDITHFGGTGTGSIVATLLACGYTLEETRDALYKLGDSFAFKQKRCFSCLDASQNKMFKKGKKFFNTIDSLINKKHGTKNITFKELFKRTGKHLKMSIMNLQNNTYYEIDHINRPYMSVSVVVYICSCVSLLLRPVKINKEYYIDGGLIKQTSQNIPIFVEFGDESFNRVLHIQIRDNFNITSNMIKCDHDRLLAHFFTVSVVEASPQTYEYDHDIFRIIFECNDIFFLNDNQKQHFINIGNVEFCKFLTIYNC
jgi:predicted acylesterase/phospholipase RssA